MNVHWLAIDRKMTSYEELKYRRVVAQGWSGVGDLSSLLPLVRSGKNSDYLAFVRVVTALERSYYGNDDHGGEVLWRLLNVQAGDLVVGIEGTMVRGLCQVVEAGVDSYRPTLPVWAYDYGQTIGFPVTWIDWDTQAFGFTPTAPRLSVQGIRGLKNDRARILPIWSTHGYRHDGYVDGAIE